MHHTHGTTNHGPLAVGGVTRTLARGDSAHPWDCKPRSLGGGWCNQAVAGGTVHNHMSTNHGPRLALGGVTRAVARGKSAQSRDYQPRSPGGGWCNKDRYKGVHHRIQEFI